MKKLLLMSVLCFGMCSFVLAQDAPKDRPQRSQRPPQVQCEEMKKLMKAVQDHRTTCEVCKTNLPPRGQGGRGQGGPAPR